MEGFFAAETKQPTRRPLTLIPKCGACQLYKKGCKSPKMPVSGQGEKGILIVGEFPGEVDDEKGTMFVGKGGQRLRDELRELDINPNRDCWLTSALICRPPQGKVHNEEAIAWCRPNIIQTIKDKQPKVIILLGGRAVRSVIGWLWRESVGALSRWVGWNIPAREINAWVCPTWHPSHVEQQDNPVMDKQWAGHLAKAVGHSLRPYALTPPKFADLITVELDAGRAARTLHKRFIARQKPVAFDYETTTLKPDDPDTSQIWACSVSDGQVTLAYPWQGEAIEATKKLLFDKKVPKIGYNIKFEDRWTRTKLGGPVRNWLWCGMTAAHVLDNRPLITSLKFQAFVLLGQGDYDSHVHPYLEGNGGYGINRVKNLPLPELLLYCGIDSLLEYKVAHMQMRKFGIPIEGIKI